MKVYLAARYSRHEELQEYASLIEDSGHKVTSRWIHGSHDIARDAQDDEERARFAMEDFEDLLKAEICVSFTEDPGAKPKKPGKGGRHVEFGVALAMNLRTVIIGPRENVFHWLPTVEMYTTFDEFLDSLEEADP